MKKKPFISLEKALEIEKEYKTPWHIYDERGIRENAKRLNEALRGIRALKSILPLKPLRILLF